MATFNEIHELLINIDLTLTNLNEGVYQTQLSLLAPRRYRAHYYNVHTATPSQVVVMAYTAADAVTQVENTFRGMHPAPTRVHHVEPYPDEPNTEE